MAVEIDQIVRNAINSVANNLSILIVSKDSYGRHLREAFNNQQESLKLGYNFAVHITDNIETIFKVIPKSKISFVIFLIDTQNSSCLTDVEKDIGYLDETLMFGRSCIVRHYSGHQDPIDISNDIWGLCEKYGLNLLVDDLTVLASFENLAARLLRLMEAACGVNTGMPFFPGQLGVLGYNVSGSENEL